MNRYFSVLLLVLLASTSWAWPAKVVGISDGDTVTVLREGHEQVKIRLYGIDAPESAQPFGKASKAMLSALVFGKTVEIDPTDTDRYGRTVARINANGVDVNQEMIKTGNAWLYRQYCTGSICSKWATLEAQAKTSGAGLWADSGPIPPWDWRKGGGTSSAAKATSPVQSSYSGGSSGSGYSAPTTYSATDQPQSTQDASSGPYSGNTESNIFHRAGCRHYGCKNCGASFSSREAAIAAGYRPCGICKP